MTRTDIIKEGLKFGSDKGYGDLSGVVPRIVHVIYDHFESQQCQNCQYWEKVEQNYDPRQYGECSKHISTTPSNLTVEDFGCNKFKERE